MLRFGDYFFSTSKHSLSFFSVDILRIHCILLFEFPFLLTLAKGMQITTRLSKCLDLQYVFCCRAFVDILPSETGIMSKNVSFLRVQQIKSLRKI